MLEVARINLLEMSVVKSFQQLCVEAEVSEDDRWILESEGIVRVEKMRFKIKSEEVTEKWSFQKLRPFHVSTDEAGKKTKAPLETPIG